MKKIIAALISLTLFYSSTVCIFAIENQECPYYEEITDVIELKKVLFYILMKKGMILTGNFLIMKRLLKQLIV